MQISDLDSTGLEAGFLGEVNLDSPLFAVNIEVPSQVRLHILQDLTWDSVSYGVRISMSGATC